MSENQFALALLDWHGGQGTGLYAVGSSLFAGHWPSFEQMVRAIRELKRERIRALQYGRHDDAKELRELRSRLELMLRCNEQYCGDYQRWLSEGNTL